MAPRSLPVANWDRITMKATTKKKAAKRKPAKRVPATKGARNFSDAEMLAISKQNELDGRKRRTFGECLLVVQRKFGRIPALESLQGWWMSGVISEQEYLFLVQEAAEIGVDDAPITSKGHTSDEPLQDGEFVPPVEELLANDITPEKIAILKEALGL